MKQRCVNLYGQCAKGVYCLTELPPDLLFQELEKPVLDIRVQPKIVKSFTYMFRMWPFLTSHNSKNSKKAFSCSQKKKKKSC